MQRLPLVLALSLALGACSTQEASAPTPGPSADQAPKTVELISRDDLFANPQKAGAQLSPDGNQIAYLAPDQGVLNIFVGPADGSAEAKVITADRHRGIRNFQWATDSQSLLFLQDQGGDENFHVYIVPAGGGEARDLTPFEGARASLLAVSEQRPEAILVNANDRDKSWFDVLEISLADGAVKRVVTNEGYESFYADQQYRIRLASKPTADGGYEFLRADGKGGFEPLFEVPAADSLTTGIAGLSADGETVYLLDSRERNTSALFALKLADGSKTLLHEDPRADVGGLIQHPVTGVAQAASVNYLRNEWAALDPAFETDLARLRENLGAGEIDIVSRTRDESVWLIGLNRSNEPYRYFRFQRSGGEVTPLFTSRPELEGKPLVKMQPVVIKSRDGLDLPSYYSLPLPADPEQDGKPNQTAPMVLLVHGGPWARDGYSVNRLHQWLANRGYAVLAVNYRGSTGFGKDFVNASNLEWAGKMHDDLIDAVNWAVAEKITTEKQIAIMGGSYGGYATLVGLTYTPDTFACGVDIVGPSNLNTLLSTIPPYWKSFFEVFATRVGDPRTEEGKKLLDDRSPLNRVEAIKKPLLIGQGANDPRVKQAESDQIVAAMQAKNIPVTYVLFPDEGHGFARPENNKAFYAVTEAFLGNCLGGRVEPLGDDLAGSSIQVPAGAEQIEGLSPALQTLNPPAGETAGEGAKAEGDSKGEESQG